MEGHCVDIAELCCVLVVKRASVLCSSAKGTALHLSGQGLYVNEIGVKYLAQTAALLLHGGR